MRNSSFQPSNFGVDAEDSSTKAKGPGGSPRDVSSGRLNDNPYSSPARADDKHASANGGKLYTEPSLSQRQGSPVPVAVAVSKTSSQFGLGEELIGKGADKKANKAKHAKGKGRGSSSSSNSSSSSSSSDSDASKGRKGRVGKSSKNDAGYIAVTDSRKSVGSKTASYGLDAEATSSKAGNGGVDGERGRKYGTNSPANVQSLQPGGYGLAAEARPGSPAKLENAAGYGLAAEASGSQPAVRSPPKQPAFGFSAELSKPATLNQPRQVADAFGLDAEQRGSAKPVHNMGQTHHTARTNGIRSRPPAVTGTHAQSSHHANRQQVLGQCGVVGLQEVTFSGRPYLLDRDTSVVFKDVNGHNVPEPVGKVVNGHVVFTPPTSETKLYTALAEYLQRKQLALEDVFAALDTDMDGCLRVGFPGSQHQELATLMTDVSPGLLTTEVLFFSSLADFDGDGYVSMEDLQAAGAACFEAAAECELAGLSPLISTLHQVTTLLNTHRDRVQLLFSTLDSSRMGWLDPAAWVRFFRALLPDLSPVQIRYILAQLYQGPEDNRKSLSEITRLLMEADTHLARTSAAWQPHTSSTGSVKNEKLGHTTSAKQQHACQLRAQYLAKAEPVLAALSQHGSCVAAPDGRSAQQGCQPAAVQTLPRNPRAAVSTWFQALAAYTSRGVDMPAAAYLKDLLARCDVNKDGMLDTVDIRRMIQAVLPGVTEAQAVYIKAALNPGNRSVLSYEDVLRTVAKLSASLAWETPAGGQAPLDALYLLSTFMSANKVKLQVLVSMFDGDGNAVLGTHDLARMLRYAQPGLSSRQVDMCLTQLYHQVDQDHDGMISCQDLRVALQQRQARLAMMRRQRTGSHAGAAGAPEDHDLSTSSPWDPFTLASLAMLSNSQVSSGRGVPLAPHSLLPTTTGSAAAPAVLGSKAVGPPGCATDAVPSSPHGSAHTTLTVAQAKLAADQADSVRTAQLDPLVYCGYTYLHDPVPNLVYLPVKVAPGSAQDGAPCTSFTGCSLSVLQGTCSLLLFGRLRPDKHVQRVETAVANALFKALDQQLQGTHTTLEQLVARFAVQPSQPCSQPVKPRLDLVGVAQLAQALVPAWSAVRGVQHYLMALFDVDGDGLVSADDIMDAFEEAGTTVDTLQTPAHVVHAKAYKLLSRLASHVVGPAGQVQGTRSLFQRCDVDSKGGLTLPELARFIASLSYEAAINQATTQQDLIGQPTAYPVQATSGPHAGNPAAAGATCDDVGALCVYVASRIMGHSPHLTWDALLQILRPMNARLPTHIAEAGPLPDRPSSPSLPHSLLSTAASPAAVMRYPTNAVPNMSTTPGSPAARTSIHNTAVATQAGALGTAYCSSQQYQQCHAAASNRPASPHTSPSATATLQHTSGIAARALERARAAVGTPGYLPMASFASEAEALVTVRRAPLRAEAAASTCGAAQASRREVALVHHSTYSSNTAGTPQQVLLLDAHTGLLYRAPAELYQPAKPAGSPANNRPAAASHTWMPSSGSAAALGGYKRPGSSCGAAPVMAPSLSMGHPELVGKLDGAVHKLQVAPVPTLSAVFHVLSSAAQDGYQLQTLYKLHDKDGGGLDLHGLHQLLAACAPPASASCTTRSAADVHVAGSAGSSRITTSHADMILAALDVDGNGRVTWQQLTQGLTVCEQAGVQRMTSAQWRAMRVLHDAAQLLGKNLRAFWLLCTITDPRRVGGMDLDTACGLLAQLLHGMQPADLELVYAYIGAAHVGCTQRVTPDELLQLLHVLPLRYNGPLLNRAAVASPRSNPLATDDASNDLLACLASDDEGVLFKPGFLPLPVTPIPDVAANRMTGAGVPGMPQYVPDRGFPAAVAQQQQAGQRQAELAQQARQPAGTPAMWDERWYPFVYAGMSPPHHTQLCMATRTAAQPGAGPTPASSYPTLSGLRPQPAPWKLAAVPSATRVQQPTLQVVGNTAQFNKQPWNGVPPTYVQPPYDLQGYMLRTYHDGTQLDKAQLQQDKKQSQLQQGPQWAQQQRQDQVPAGYPAMQRDMANQIGLPMQPQQGLAYNGFQQAQKHQQLGYQSPGAAQGPVYGPQTDVKQAGMQSQHAAVSRDVELYDEALAARDANAQLRHQMHTLSPKKIGMAVGLGAEASFSSKPAVASVALHGLHQQATVARSAGQYGLMSEDPPAPAAPSAKATYGLASEPSLAFTTTQFGLAAEDSIPATGRPARPNTSSPAYEPQPVGAALNRTAAQAGALTAAHAEPARQSGIQPQPAFKDSVKQQDVSSSGYQQLAKGSPVKQTEFGLLGESVSKGAGKTPHFGLLSEADNGTRMP